MPILSKGNPRKKDAVLYCITDGEYYKIGWTTNLEKRIKSLRCGNPRKLRVLQTIPCNGVAQAKMREKTIHKSARKHKLHGEWYASDEVLNNKYWMRYLRQEFRRQFTQEQNDE